MVWSIILSLSTKAKAIAVVAAGGLLTWVTTTNWQNVANSLVGIANILLLGFIALRSQFRADRRKEEIEDRERRRKEELEDREHRRQQEIEDRDSLTKKLESAHQQNVELIAKMTELTESVGKERKSIHDQRDEMNAEHLAMRNENDALHKRLSDNVHYLSEASDGLAKANRRIVELTCEVGRLGPTSARQTKEVIAEVQAIADRVVAATTPSEGDTPARHSPEKEVPTPGSANVLEQQP